MTASQLAALGGVALLALGCAGTVVVPARPAPPPAARPSSAATLGIPPGHLPRPGECRVWIPGVPPGRQRSARSRDCRGIAYDAPAGSWIVYRPTHDRKHVHVRVVDDRRPGVIVVLRLFDTESGRFVREERTTTEALPSVFRRDREPERTPAEPRRREPERPRMEPQAPPAEPERRRPEPERPVAEPQPPRREPERREPPRMEPQRPPAQPEEQRPGPRDQPDAPGRPAAPAKFDIPPGHLPDAGQCRIWLPGTPPGRQSGDRSRSCQGIAQGAPAGSWIVYRPAKDKKHVHLRLVDQRRAGVVVTVAVFDVASGRFVREEKP
jgi:hypothetical protein